MTRAPATSGPVPKRRAERAGHVTKGDAPDVVAMPDPVRPPPARSSWDPAARAWYRSLRRSGQSRYYEPSDWELARILCDLLTNELAKPKGPSSEMTKAILSSMDALGTTESARRRMRIEIDRGSSDDVEDEATTAALAQVTRLRGGTS